LNKSYYNTDTFVDELQKDLKTEKRVNAKNTQGVATIQQF
jgi:hypothetical protein